MKENRSSYFATKLRDLIFYYELSVEDFAKRIGVDKTNVYKWLSGKSKPHFEALAAISREFDVDLNEYVKED